MRIWVDIDWSKIDKHDSSAGNIHFKGDGIDFTVGIRVNNIDKSKLSGFNGFVENNGMVSIQATHFSRQIIRPRRRWELLDDLGYCGSVLQALPVTTTNQLSADADSVRKNHSFVDYDFYTFTAASPSVYVFTLPTLLTRIMVFVMLYP